MEQEENVKTIAEYIEVVVRRKWLLIISVIVIGFLGFVLAMKLPPVYRSYATILIEDQKIPRSMVQTTITDFADKRIELIKQRVMTRDRILSLIEKHKLYLDEREQLLPSELVDLFKENAEVNLISADVRDPQRGGISKATIAFTIAFSDKDPVLAQSVTNDLVSFFLNENTRTRAQRASKTTEFLRDEAEKLKKEVQKVEGQIMDFKARHGNSLPEMMKVNLDAIERARNDLRQAEGDIRIAQDRIAYLTESLHVAKDELPVGQQGAPLSRAEQLRLLKSQYIQISSLYKPEHPDVLRLKHQIQKLEPEFTGKSSQLSIQKELENARKSLELLKNKYADSHPDIVKLEQKIKNLQQDFQQEEQGEGEDIQGSAHYISLLGQLRTTEHELEYLLKLRKETRQKINELQKYLDKTPLVEKEYQDLLRQRQTSINKFAELESKYREARLAQTMEEEQKGETFLIVEPPIAPDKPDKPNRKKIVALGLGAGVGFGLFLVILMEAMHTVIRGPKSLERVIGNKPVVCIPYVETPQDIQRKKRQKRLIGLGMFLVIVAIVVITHFWIMPLEMIWAKVLTKLTRL